LDELEALELVADGVPPEVRYDPNAGDNDRLSLPSLHQSQEESANDQSAKDKEEEDGDVGRCGEPGAVDVKRVGEHGIRIVKFGCMSFAVSGEDNDKARELAKQLHEVLKKLFVRPTSLELKCPKCEAVAPSIPVLTWHVQTMCSKVNTPRRKQLSSSIPMAFLISEDLIRLMESTNCLGMPFDILDPWRIPIPVGASAVHQFKIFAAELKSECQILKTRKELDVFCLLKKKQKWLTSVHNVRPKQTGFPDLLLLQFVKNSNEWPEGCKEMIAQYNLNSL
jgi:hypothetical protein